MGKDNELSGEVLGWAVAAEKRDAQRRGASDREIATGSRFCTLWKIRIVGFLEHLSWRDNRGFDIDWLAEKNDYGEMVLDRETLDNFIKGKACLEPHTLNALAAKFDFKSSSDFLDAALEFLPSDKDEQDRVYAKIKKRLKEDLIHLS